MGLFHIIIAQFVGIACNSQGFAWPGIKSYIEMNGHNAVFITLSGCWVGNKPDKVFMLKAKLLQSDL
jgi:hypothetical protein